MLYGKGAMNFTTKGIRPIFLWTTDLNECGKLIWSWTITIWVPVALAELLANSLKPRLNRSAELNFEVWKIAWVRPKFAFTFSYMCAYSPQYPKSLQKFCFCTTIKSGISGSAESKTLNVQNPSHPSTRANYKRQHMHVAPNPPTIPQIRIHPITKHCGD